jgi:hypothetical protein
MTKRAGVGVGFGSESVNSVYGSKDTGPYQNVTDPEHCFFYCRRCNAARAELFSLMSSQKVVDVSRTQGGVRNSNLKVCLVFFVNNL